MAATMLSCMAHLLVFLRDRRSQATEERSSRERESVFDLRDAPDLPSGGPAGGAAARSVPASPAPVAVRTFARPAGAPAARSTARADGNPLDDPFTDWFLLRSCGFTSRSPAEAGHDGDGTGGGTGAGTGSGDRSGKGALARSRARPATLLPNWDCHYPGETENTGFVRMMATVRPDGTAASVQVFDDPGFGFAQVAIDCAMRQPFLPALDERGLAVEGKTRPFIVRFIH